MMVTKGPLPVVFEGSEEDKKEMTGDGKSTEEEKERHKEQEESKEEKKSDRSREMSKRTQVKPKAVLKVVRQEAIEEIKDGGQAL
jgi:hypothetical protein